MNAVTQFDREKSARLEQLEEGRRLSGQTLTVRPGAPRRFADDGLPTERHASRPLFKTPVKTAAKAPAGHEAFLKALETSGAQIEVEKMSGEKLIGRVKHSDKFTISLRVESGGVVRDRVLFKHDLSEFSAISPRPAQTPPDADEEGHYQ